MNLQRVNLQQISISSSLNSQHEVHQGENITIQCITRGSSILAWSCNEYIGSGRIEFSTTSTPLITHNQYTLARLIDQYDENGRGVLVSQLSIIAQGTIQQSTVMCHHVQSGQAETITFQLSSKFLFCCNCNYILIFCNQQ